MSTGRSLGLRGLLGLLASIAAAGIALAGGVFDSEQCVALVSRSARMVSVIPPGSTDNNETTSFPFEKLPTIKAGDLVRVVPAHGDATPLPTFSVIARRSSKCRSFWSSGAPPKRARHHDADE